MTNTRFCLFSLLLAILALGVHGGALRARSQNASIRAQAASVTREQRAIMRAQGGRFHQRGSILYAVGLCLAVAGAASLIVSFRRKESAPWRAVPTALLLFYVIFQFVLV